MVFKLLNQNDIMRQIIEFIPGEQRINLQYVDQYFYWLLDLQSNLVIKLDIKNIEITQLHNFPGEKIKFQNRNSRIMLKDYIYFSGNIFGKKISDFTKVAGYISNYDNYVKEISDTVNPAEQYQYCFLNARSKVIRLAIFLIFAMTDITCIATLYYNLNKKLDLSNPAFVINIISCTFGIVLSSFVLAYDMIIIPIINKIIKQNIVNNSDEKHNYTKLLNLYKSYQKKFPPSQITEDKILSEQKIQLIIKK